MDSYKKDQENGKRKVVIAGGGLVGALCACVLAKRGYRVEVFESRSDPRSDQEKALAQGRSINLALSARGRAALSRAGLEDVVLSQAIPMRGRMIHSINGSTKMILYDPNTQQCIYSVSRQFLNELLISEAENQGNVALHFSHKLVEANLEKGLLTFRDETGDNIEIQGDLLVGADGAHSSMRRALLKRPMTNFSQTYIDHGYMELKIPANADGQHAMPKNYLHIWPRNEFMLIALPNLDGSFTVTLFMPISKFAELSNEASVDLFFSTEFPDAMELIGKELLIKDFVSSRPSHLISVKCSPVSIGKGVLIGDAAHAMVPFYGQGMNAGFEDVLLLDNALAAAASQRSTVENGNGVSKTMRNQRNGMDLENILAKFSKDRVPDAHAICELALYNYVEMRCLVNQSGFIYRRFIDYKLHKILGRSWTPLYNNVTFSLTPYAECIQQKKWQDHVMNKAKNLTWTTLGVLTCLGVVLWRDTLLSRIQHVTRHFPSVIHLSPL